MILKRILLIIFAGSIFENENIYELIPQGLIDILVFAQEEIVLPEILNRKSEYQLLPNIAIYKNGQYQESERKILDTDQHKGIRDFIDFGKFNLEIYDSSKLPLILKLRDNK